MIRVYNYKSLDSLGNHEKKKKRSISDECNVNTLAKSQYVTHL